MSKITPTTEAIPFEVSEALLKLGQNIRVDRLRRRLTQEELAQKCHVTRKTIYALENGSPGISSGTLFSVLWMLDLLTVSDIPGKTQDT